ncbi:MAG: heme lyase CcmF/NrfE family subunit [Proteobacteria bacterium]|nr:heme lyase CcmF/NrfE family subunit [Pseudomonadota bacterium]MDA0845972.1 heme lyase CcmF/NrfE family subunit [Pseudomonadota bacterium]
MGLTEFGHFALISAFVLSLIQSVVPLIGTARHNMQLMLVGPAAAISAAVACVIAFGALVTSFIRSDFSVALVANHSHSAKPLIYKISGTWGNHEGSLLLWILILVIYGAVLAISGRTMPALLKARILAVQGMITSGFLAFSLFTSNPFTRLANAPIDGKGLNPILQDPGLAIHPPMLYLGYVGLSIAFAFAVAGLIGGDVDRLWAKWMRPWIMAAWCALTLGIALGSWWAYYELGWGGWWFWDPVENASLMPWLAATALLHSAIVVEKRGQLKSWTVLLAILAFSLSLVGTFIVRSGLLTSVHSFASDPARGVFILGILLVAVGIPLLLYAWRGPQLMSVADFNLKSREGALIANNMLLVVATAIVLLGTFYPLGLEMITGARITVGPPYFDATFNPVMGILVVIMVIGPVMAWRRGATPRAKTTLLAASVLAIIAGVIGVALLQDIAIGAVGAIMLIAWLAIGIATDIWTQLKPLQRGGLAARWHRLPTEVLGMWIAHFGIVVFLLGATGDVLFRSEQVVRAKPGEVVTIAGRDVTLVRVFERQGPNFQALTAELEYKDAASGKFIARLMPEKRVYTAERQTTTEAAIRPRLGGDDYAVLGDGDDRIGYSLRLYYKPLISWIWGGGALMAAGGLVAMIGRRRQSAVTAPLPNSVARDTA